MEDQSLTATERVRLLDVDPDLGAELSSVQREYVEHVLVHVVRVKRGTIDPEALLARAGAFAAVILDGVLLHRLAITAQPALRLLGPGDVLARAGRPCTSLIVHVDHRAGEHVRVAMLDDGVLLAACRAPRLFVGLHRLLAEQHQRLAAQLAVCQLPRVEQRLQALMWLLAETWGRVTPAGTLLPIALTHDALGEMIGARRPTVTLAISSLTRRGALIRHEDGWLLLEPPARAATDQVVAAEPELLSGLPTPWREPASEPIFGPSPEMLSQIVRELREGDDATARDLAGRLERSRAARDRYRRMREQIAADRRRRRAMPGPSAPAPPQ
ncbi:MAG: Crp/Fnr family transcriptional regulator [Solirubrobacteraceae bacterium]